MMSIEELLEIIENLRKQINSLRKQVNENVQETSSVDFRNFFPENVNVISENIESNEDNTTTKEEREEQLENLFSFSSSASQSNSGGFSVRNIARDQEFEINEQRAKIFSIGLGGDEEEVSIVTPEPNKFGISILSREEIDERVENFEERVTTSSSDIFGDNVDNNTVYETIGTDIRDRLFGDERNDVLRGEDGNDRILSSKGDDVLFGGNGNDIISGGRDDDVLIPGDGDFFDFTSNSIETGTRISDNMDLIIGGDTSSKIGFDTAILRGTQDDWDFGFDDNDSINAQSNSLDQSVKLIGIEEIQFVNSSQKIDTETL